MSKKNNYKVYVHINKVNGKRYYGITMQEVEKRWANGKGYPTNEHFTNAINKYGWNEGFEHIVLFDNLTEEEAKLLEQMYIALYDTTNQDKGYNISLGGEGGNGYKHTEEWKQEKSKAMKGIGSKKVYCVELDMYFDSITEACEYVGDNNRTISEAIRGKCKTCKGYHWLYAEDVNEENINRVMSEEYNSITEEYRKKMSERTKKMWENEEYRKKQSEAHKGEKHHMYGKKGKDHPNSTKVYCVELDMYFDSVTEASEYIGCCKQYISAVLKGRSKTAKGYHFIYANEVNEENINKVMSEEYNNSKREIKIYCVELDKYFDSITEGAEYVGCSYSSVRNVLTGWTKTCKGMHWVYAEDVEKLGIENKEVS